MSIRSPVKLAETSQWRRQECMMGGFEWAWTKVRSRLKKNLGYVSVRTRF